MKLLAASARLNPDQRIREIWVKASMHRLQSSERQDCVTDLSHGHTVSRVREHGSAVALRVDGLSKTYGAIKAVAGVTFDIRQGEIFGLLGLNGAGKSTLISMLATERRPSAGDALLLGHSIRKERRTVRQVIGVAPQQIALYPMLTAAENLRFIGRIYGMKGAQLEDRVEGLLKSVALEDRGSDYVRSFSGGMKRRLNLAAALVHEPELILLDEPTAGVDPESRNQILKIVRRLRNDGKAILYTTHYMDEAEELSDRIGILNAGRLIAAGTLEELRDDLEFSEVIELSGPTAGIDLVPMRTLGQIYRVERDENRLRVLVKRATDFLLPLQKIVSRTGKSIQLKIGPLSLEDLFLHLARKEANG
jgi:ABC-2 type transport system ATP-binding protein